MSKNQIGRPGQIPAVGYLRRSTNRQERSLQDQLREIETYAKLNGYRILRWYTDDGISGDATECRHEFLKMHKAATNGRDFDVILVWDFSRFGRFDSIEAGRWIHPLRQAGVKLVTVAEGVVDWDCFSGRIMNALHAEGKHSFLTDLSRNVARSLSGVAQEGRLCGQAAPYGFDRMLVDERGEHKQRIRTGEKFSKPRGWRTTLVAVRRRPEGLDPSLVVPELRRHRYRPPQPRRSIECQGRCRTPAAVPGTPRPSRRFWKTAITRARSRGPNGAKGNTTASPQGRFGSGTGAKSRSPRPESHTPSITPSEAWIVVEDAHEAIIDKRLFDRVQAKLQVRRRSNPAAVYRTHTRYNGDSYLLSGLVFCAHCGCKMHGAKLCAEGTPLSEIRVLDLLPQREEQPARLWLPRRRPGPVSRRIGPKAPGDGADRRQPRAIAERVAEPDRAAGEGRVSGERVAPQATCRLRPRD